MPHALESTHHLGPFQTLSIAVRASIRCAVEDPTTDAYVDGAYLCTRALTRLALALQPAYVDDDVASGRTVPGIGPGGWDSGALARDQETHAARQERAQVGGATVFRIYTETKGNLAGIVASYFDAATLYLARGLYRRAEESATIIEIIGDYGDRSRVEMLAVHIARANSQSEVLITLQSSHGFERVTVSTGGDDL